MSVRVDGSPPGWAGRVMRAVAIGGSPVQSALAWSEDATGAVHARAIALDVSDLRPGEYTLRIGIETAGGLMAERERSFRVAETPRR